MASFVVPDSLAVEMCGRLGVSLPSSLADTARLYRAWCGRVPFDTIAKVLAVAEGRVPPGDDPVEFCERFLDTGVGGTCWGHVTAFVAVLAAGGVESRVGVERMRREDRVDFHSFVVVDGEGGGRWLCDLIHASGDPLPMRDGAEGNQGVLGTGVGRDPDGRWTHWYSHPSRTEPSRYIMLSEGLDAGDVRAFCEVSTKFSGVSANRFWCRRAPFGSLVAGSRPDDGVGLVVKVWTGPELDEQLYVDLDEGFAALGYGEGARAMAERAGLLSS